MVRKHRGTHGFLGPSWVLITTYSTCIIRPPAAGVREYPNYSINNQNQMWCVNIGEYMVLGPSWVLISTYGTCIIRPPVVGVRDCPNYSINKQN